MCKVAVQAFAMPLQVILLAAKSSAASRCGISRCCAQHPPHSLSSSSGATSSGGSELAMAAYASEVMVSASLGETAGWITTYKHGESGDGGDWANVDGSSPVEAAGAQPAWLDWPECDPSSKGKARTQLTPAVHPAGKQQFALTLTLPGYNRYSLALGIRSPVPTRVMGTTGTCGTEHEAAGRHSCGSDPSQVQGLTKAGRQQNHTCWHCHGWDVLPVQKATFTAAHELRLSAALHAASCMLHYKWGPTPAAASHSAPLILHQGPT